MINVLIAILLIVMVGHPVSAQGHDDHEREKSTHQEDSLKWTPELQKEFGIETQIARSGTIEKTRELPGEVEFHLDYLAHLTSRYSGIVKSIRKHVGDSVRKGDVLAVIESNDSLTNYQITAPISGVIFEKHLTLGESVPDSTEIFKIADTSHLWATFHVYSDLSPYVKKGDTVILQNKFGDTLKTKVSYVSPSLSTTTRTRQARANIETNSTKWSAGTFIRVLYPYQTSKGDIVIPKTALQKIDNKWAVFVKHDNEFELEFVEIGEEDANNVILTRGIKPGQEIVSKGSFVLKAELEKTSFGDGHGH